MIIKKFEKFNINESFIQTYDELLSSKSKPESFFLDSLLDVYDMSPKTKVDYYNYIIDDTGHMIDAGKLKNIEDYNYRIRYVVVIKFNTPSDISLDEYEKELDGISTIILSIREMISRCIGGGLELVLNKVIQPGDFSKSFIIHFDEKIDKVAVLSAFKSIS
jgi:hypothetical protein